MAAYILLVGLLLLLGIGYPLIMSLWWLTCLLRGHKEPYLDFMRYI